MKAFIAIAVICILLAVVVVAIYPLSAKEYPPIGQWISCDDPRYETNCDLPSGPAGLPPNNTISDNVTISLVLTNGTIINLRAFANGIVFIN